MIFKIAVQVIRLSIEQSKGVSGAAGGGEERENLRCCLYMLRIEGT